jgi:glycosyltransferase 2 family protein
MDEAPRPLSSDPPDLNDAAPKGAQGGPAPATDATAMARGLTRKVMLAALFGGVVFAALALYGDVQQMRRAAMSFAPAAVALGFGLAAGNYVLRIWRWQYYLRCLGVSVPLFESSVVFLSGFVMSVTPGKVGEVFKSLLLYELRGVSMVRTAPIVIAERLTDLIALVLLTALGSLAFEHGVAIAGAGALVVALMVAVFAYRPLGEYCIGLLERIPALAKIGHKMHEAYAALLTMLRPGPLLFGTLIAVGAWGLECGSLYAIVSGFPKVHLNWDAATFAYSASTIVGALAMLPGGLGVTEAGMTGLLQALGGPDMTRAVATAATMLTRLATLWFAVAIGWVAFGVYRTSLRRPDGAPATTP